MSAPSVGDSPLRPVTQTGLIVRFVAMGLVWGASFLFMKVALDGVSFGQVAWSRLVLGGLTLGVVVLVSRSPLPREPRLWMHFVVIAVTGSVLPSLLFAWGTQQVTSSLASIFNAVTPLTTAIMAVLIFRVEVLRGLQILGVAVGILGILVIVAPWQAALGGSLAGQLACLGAVTLYGFTFAYTRKFISPRPVSGITAAFLQIGIAAVMMLILTPWVATGPVELNAWIVLSLVLLGAVGTGFAYTWYMVVLRAWGPTRTATFTYITPVVGVALGIIVLGETLSWNEPVGAVIALVGIVLTNRKSKSRLR